MIELTPELIDGFTKSLNDFGYNIDREHVEATAKAILRGETTSGGPAMFIAGWIDDLKNKEVN